MGQKTSAATAKRTETVRILHISDTHNLITEQLVKALPDADILIHTGDFTDQGTTKEFQDFNKFLEMMSDKYKYRVVIPGNHDTYQVDLQYDKIKSCLTGATHFPLHETVTIMGLSIYGVPWWPGHSWNYKLFKGWPNVKDPAGFGNIPDQIDVLLTHGPPNGVLDEADGVKGNHSGSLELSKEIARVRPRACLWGHVHEQRGAVELKFSDIDNGGKQGHDDEKKKATKDKAVSLCVNSAMTDRWRSPKQLQRESEGAGPWCGAHLIEARRVWTTSVSSATGKEEESSSGWSFRVITGKTK